MRGLINYTTKIFFGEMFYFRPIKMRINACLFDKLFRLLALEIREGIKDKSFCLWKRFSFAWKNENKTGFRLLEPYSIVRKTYNTTEMLFFILFMHFKISFTTKTFYLFIGLPKCFKSETFSKFWILFQD